MTFTPTLLPCKIGYNTSLNTSAFIPLSSNLSITMPSGQQAQVQSTSTTDTSPSGVGVQKVLITYFDTSWVLKTEIVVMNGTTAVLTVATNILRIEGFEIFQVGTNGTAQGTITLTNVGNTSTFAQIEIGFTIFLRAVHFVAPGHIATMTDITANCPTSGGTFFSAFITKDNTSSGGNQIGIPQNAFILANNVVHIPLTPSLLTGTFPIICDASLSTVGLMMGIAVKGLAATQTAIASFHYIDNIA